MNSTKAKTAAYQASGFLETPSFQDSDFVGANFTQVNAAAQGLRAEIAALQRGAADALCGAYMLRGEMQALARGLA